jgi:PAS domain S-box-containing protein
LLNELKDKPLEDFQIKHDFANLGRKTMLLNARCISQEDSGASLILLAIEDITEGKQAEDDLRASEQKYRTLFEAIDEGFCIIEKVEERAGGPLDFRYILANPAFETQSGVGDVVGKTIRQAFPHESEEWFETYDAIVKTGEPLRFQRNLATQGRVLELYAFRVEDETHRRVAVIFRDVTEQKRAEELKGRLAAIVESTDDAVISKDLNGSFGPGTGERNGYLAMPQRRSLEKMFQLWLRPIVSTRCPASLNVFPAASALTIMRPGGSRKTGE